MALQLKKSTPIKASEQESSMLIAGSNAVRLVKAGETFVANIKSIIPNVPSVISEILADDGLNTDVVGAGDGELNIAGVSLLEGSYIVPNSAYKNSKSFTSVSCSTGSLWVYYNITIDNAG